MFRRLLLVSLLMTPLSLFAQNPGKPALERIAEGATTVKGSIVNADNSVKVTVTRKRTNGSTSTYESALADGIFTATLPTPALAGEKFVSKESKGNQDSDEVLVTHTKPTFSIVPMYEGDLSISGRVLNPGPSTQVFMLRKSGREVVSINMDGTFTKTLTTTGLIAEEAVTFVPDLEPDANQAALVQTKLATPGQEGDLGFGRYYFTGGTIISKKNDFQAADLHVAFNFDKSWLVRDPAKEDKNRPAVIEGRPVPYKSPFQRTYFNTYFDARLTSIPIAPGSGSESATTTTTTTTTNATTGAAGATGTTTTQTSDPLDQIAISKKAALLQIGAYIPIIVNQMSVNGDPNALFLAPIGKMGLQTLTGSNTSAEGRTLGGDDLYNFHAYGMRLGQFRLTSGSSTPQTIWYLDMTLGHWENFELCTTSYQDSAGKDQIKKSICPEIVTDGSNGTLPMRRFRPLRYAFEGRLKVPALPLLIGFDVNAGKGPDDVRFLFGTRFDIGELVRKIH